MVVGLYGLWAIAFSGFSFLGFIGFGNSLGKSGPERFGRQLGARDVGRQGGRGGQGRKKGVKKKSLRTAIRVRGLVT